jgi:hypothetical protein
MAGHGVTRRTIFRVERRPADCAVRGYARRLQNPRIGLIIP